MESFRQDFNQLRENIKEILRESYKNNRSKITKEEKVREAISSWINY